MKVVIFFLEVLGCWSIAHAKSYQKAFRKSFATEESAIEFANKNGCEIVEIKK